VVRLKITAYSNSDSSSKKWTYNTKVTLARNIVHLPNCRYIVAMKPTSFLPFFQLVASQALTYWADSGYSACTQGCLENIYETQACSLANACFCTSSTSSSTSCLCLTSSCLCETSSWLIAIAQCIGKTCGADNVTIAASVADSDCSGSGYPLAIASTALVSYGLAAVPTGASSPTSTSTFLPLILE
jgi:hypothetical protein